MIVCERCSAENADGSQYCDECGTLLQRGTSAVLARTSFIGQRMPDAPAHGGDAEADSNQHDAAGKQTFDGKEIVARETVPVFAPQLSGSSISGGRKNVAAKLIIQRGRSIGKEFALDDDESYIGRWDADGGIFPDIDLDVDDPEAKVSRRHARIVRRNSQFFIEDLGSTNGTFVNRGRRLLPGDLQPLRDGDEIIVGKTFLRLRIMH